MSFSSYTKQRPEILLATWRSLTGSLLFLVAVAIFATCSISQVQSLGPNEPLGQLLAYPAEPPGKTLLSATLHQSEPLCFIVQRSRSGKNTATHWRGVANKTAELQLSDGTLLTVRLTGRVFWEPLNTRDISSMQDRELRERLGLSSKGWLEGDCIEEGDPLFLDGCMSKGALTDCSRSPLVITPGDGSPRPRIDELIGDALVSLFWAGLLASGLLLFCWTNFYTRALVKSLSNWAGLSTRWSGGEILLLLLFSSAWLFLAIFTSLRGSQIVVLMSCSVVAVLLLCFERRFKTLLAAWRLVKGAPTIPLSEVKSTDQIVELCATVQENTALSTAPLTQEKRAWWEYSVKRTYKSGKNTRTETLVEPISPPAPILIQDKSGEGLLDLSYADISACADSARLPAKELGAAEAAQLRLSDKYFPPDGTLHFNERYLSPGDSLYILGQVTMMQPSATGEGSYRDAAMMPIIGGDGAHKLIVFVGTEQELLGRLKTELRWVGVLLASFVAIEATLLSFLYWFSSL